MDSLHAMKIRHSVRSYASGIDPTQDNQIIEAFANTPKLDASIAVKAIVLRGVKSMSGCHIALLSEEKPGFRENIGYAGEHLVATMTDMGIATCWIAMPNLIGAAKKLLPKNEPFKLLALIACGKGLKDTTPTKEKMAIADFTEGFADEIWQDLFAYVRIAPSACNSQPWRLRTEKNRTRIYISRQGLFKKIALRELNRIDVGIAMAHLHMAAEAIDIQLEFSDEKDVPVMKGCEYIKTAVRH